MITTCTTSPPPASEGDEVVLELTDRRTGAVRELRTDLVLLGTGFSPGDARDGAAPRRRRSVARRSAVTRDYRLVIDRPSTAACYLQGVNEATHGIADSLLSVLAPRANDILAGHPRPPRRAPAGHDRRRAHRGSSLERDCSPWRSDNWCARKCHSRMAPSVSACVPWAALNAPFEGSWVVVPAGGATGTHEHHEYEIFIAMQRRRRGGVRRRAPTVQGRRHRVPRPHTAAPGDQRQRHGLRVLRDLVGHRHVATSSWHARQRAGTQRRPTW